MFAATFAFHDENMGPQFLFGMLSSPDRGGGKNNMVIFDREVEGARVKK